MQLGGTVKIAGTAIATSTFDPAHVSSTQSWWEADRISNWSNGSPLTTWSDASSNSNDAVASGAARPIMGLVGGVRVVNSDGTQKMTIPDSINQRLQDTTMFAVVYPTLLETGESLMELGALQGGIVSASAWLTKNGTGGLMVYSPNPGVEHNQIAYSTMSPTILMIRHTSSGTSLYINGQENTGIAPQDVTFTGGTLFGGNGSDGLLLFKGSTAVIGIYKQSTLQQDLDANGWLIAKYKIPYSSTANLIVAVGDSLTRGSVGAINQLDDYPDMLIDSLHAAGKDYQILDIAQNGAGTGSMLGRFITYADPFYSTGRSKNTVLWLTGTNDLFDHDATSTYAGIINAVSERHNTGWKIYLLTPTPTVLFDTTREARRVELNNLIRANSAGADGIVDLDTISGMTDPNGTGYYDGTHWSTVGKQLVAQKVQGTVGIF